MNPRSLSQSDLSILIFESAARHGLPTWLVRAIVSVESGGNPWAWNPEPAYRYLWDVRAQKPFRRLTHIEATVKTPPPDFPAIAGDRDQEWWAQQASWGLMQVMGAVARELGFTGPYLTELCDPLLNLELGCLHLSLLRDRYLARWGWPGVIAAYNAGTPRVLVDGRFSNQDYVDKIYKKKE
ncbi:MAG: lytic transglycosylase domain-containing protein [Thermosphaera sp.]